VRSWAEWCTRRTPHAVLRVTSGRLGWSGRRVSARARRGASCWCRRFRLELICANCVAPYPRALGALALSNPGARTPLPREGGHAKVHAAVVVARCNRDCVRTSDAQDGCGCPRGPRWLPTVARLRADPRNATLGRARCNGEARRHRLSVNFPPRFARALALASLSAHDPPDDRDGGLRYAER